MKHNNTSTKKRSILSILLKTYILVSYIIMSFVAYRFYEDYQKYARLDHDISAMANSPTWKKGYGLIKNIVNDSSLIDSKIRDKESIQESIKELTIAFVLAPLSVPYYLFFKKNGFPTF